MVNFAPKRKERFTSEIPFPTLLSFLPLPSASVRNGLSGYANVITKFSRSKGFLASHTSVFRGARIS